MGPVTCHAIYNNTRTSTTLLHTNPTGTQHAMPPVGPLRAPFQCWVCGKGLPSADNKMTLGYLLPPPESSIFYGHCHELPNKAQGT